MSTLISAVILGALTFFDTWLPYIYFYAGGGVFFVLGLYITHKAGTLNLKRKQHRYWLWVLILGFLWFMAIHLILNIAALYW